MKNILGNTLTRITPEKLRSQSKNTLKMKIRRSLSQEHNLPWTTFWQCKTVMDEICSWYVVVQNCGTRLVMGLSELKIRHAKNTRIRWCAFIFSILEWQPKCAATSHEVQLRDRQPQSNSTLPKMVHYTKTMIVFGLLRRTLCALSLKMLLNKYQVVHSDFLDLRMTTEMCRNISRNSTSRSAATVDQHFTKNGALHKDNDRLWIIEKGPQRLKF